MSTDYEFQRVSFVEVLENKPRKEQKAIAKQPVVDLSMQFRTNTG